MSLVKSIRQLFTGKDNDTLDLGRVLWANSVVAYFAVAFYHLYNGGTIDFASFGVGISGILAAGGAAIGLKANTEPNPPS